MVVLGSVTIRNDSLLLFKNSRTLYGCIMCIYHGCLLLINYCLMSSEQYLSYIQVENKFNTIYKNYMYIATREVYGQLEQRL